MPCVSERRVGDWRVLYATLAERRGIQAVKPQLQTVVVADRVLAIVPLDEYEELREELADAEAMIELARSAGSRYSVEQQGC